MTILRFRYSSGYVTSVPFGVINSNVYSIFIENLFICLFNECICTNNPYLKFNLNNVATAKQELTQQKFIMQHIQHYTIDQFYIQTKSQELKMECRTRKVLHSLFLYFTLALVFLLYNWISIYSERNT